MRKWYWWFVIAGRVAFLVCATLEPAWLASVMSSVTAIGGVR